MRHPTCNLNFKPGEAIHDHKQTGQQVDFIPNDTLLGGEYPTVRLVTGPNMGGKSTYLRQSCLAVILA